MLKLNQRGVIHYALLIAALALVAFIVISSSASFKDKLFAQLFPKPPSFAAGPVSGPVNPVLGATLSGPTTIGIGASLTYSATVTDSGGVLQAADIIYTTSTYTTPVNCPAKVDSYPAWCYLVKHAAVTGNQATITTKVVFPKKVNSYIIAANVYDTTGVKCSGNPKLATQTVAGWTYCGPNSSLNLSVNPSPSPTPISSIGLQINVSSVDVTVTAGSSIKAFDLLSTGATQFTLYGYPTSYGPGINWSVSSGGISNGQSYPVYIQVNSNIPAGVYTGTGIIQNGTGQQLTVPVKVTVQTPAPTPTPTSSGVTVSTNNVSVTLSRAQAVGGLIYGTGFTLTPINATSFEISPNQLVSGQGFYQSSGGFNGFPVNIQSYINGNFANGVYTGSVTVKYTQNGSSTYINGPIVNYTITLTN